MTPQSADVVVVGAGPVGLAVAAGLRLHGHSVAVVDRQPEGANTSRACVIHPRTLEMLDFVRTELHLDPLVATAIERGIRARHQRVEPSK